MSHACESSRRFTVGRQLVGLSLWLVATVALVTYSPPALAQGMLLPKYTESPAQAIAAGRTLIAREGPETVRFVYELAYQWDASHVDSVWVLPVLPGGRIEHNARCGADFDDLDALSAPLLLIQHRQTDDGCGCGPWPGSSTDGVPPAVSFGAHDWTGSGASGSIGAPEEFDSLDELVTRLQGMGVAVESGRYRELLGHYVERSYNFAFAEISNSLTTGVVCAEVVHDDHGPEYLVPLRAAGEGARSSMEVLLFVLDETRVEPPSDDSPYGVAEIEPHAIRLTSGPDSGTGETNYETLYQDAVGLDDEERERRSFVLEYSGVLPEDSPLGTGGYRWLTRLRADLHPSQIISDVPLAAARVGDEVGRTHTVLIASARPTGGGEGLLGVFALGICLVASRTIAGHRGERP